MKVSRLQPPKDTAAEGAAELCLTATSTSSSLTSLVSRLFCLLVDAGEAAEEATEEAREMAAGFSSRGGRPRFFAVGGFFGAAASKGGASIGVFFEERLWKTVGLGTQFCILHG